MDAYLAKLISRSTVQPQTQSHIVRFDPARRVARAEAAL